VTHRSHSPTLSLYRRCPAYRAHPPQKLPEYGTSMHKVLAYRCWFRLLLLLLSIGWSVIGRADNSPASGAAPVQVVDIRDFDSDRRLSAVCLQGISNRSGPRVYLTTGPSVRWMQFDFDNRQNALGSKETAADLGGRYRSICDAWIDILTGCDVQRVSCSSTGPTTGRARSRGRRCCVGWGLSAGSERSSPRSC
jgi:hypothetical protein